MPRTLNFSGSSNIKAATLNDDGTAEVAFANGGKAVYKNITPEMFDEWEKAESAGRWFHNRVRSKPTDFPMISQVKDEPKQPPAEKTGDETTAVEPLLPVPSAPIATSSSMDAGAALKAANTRIAALQTQLEQANARADKAERELELSKVALRVAKNDAARAAAAGGDGGKRDFRPWRNRR